MVALLMLAAPNHDYSRVIFFPLLMFLLKTENRVQRTDVLISYFHLTSHFVSNQSELSEIIPK